MKIFTIDNYLSTVKDDERKALEAIRLQIHKQVPDIEEKISYGLAAFYYKKKYLVAFGAFKNHLSLFPGGVVNMFKAQLSGHKLTKGSIHFTADKPLNTEVLKEIIDFRKTEIDQLN